MSYHIPISPNHFLHAFPAWYFAALPLFCIRRSARVENSRFDTAIISIDCNIFNHNVRCASGSFVGLSTNSHFVYQSRYYKHFYLEKDCSTSTITGRFVCGNRWACDCRGPCTNKRVDISADSKFTGWKYRLCDCNIYCAHIL